jgi:hypothetical protein
MALGNSMAIPFFGANALGNRLFLRRFNFSKIDMVYNRLVKKSLKSNLEKEAIEHVL